MADPMAPIRAEVLAQPAADRLDYALDLLAFYLDPVPAFYDGVCAMGLKMPLADLRMLHALNARRGRHVTINALISVRAPDRGIDDWCRPAKAVECVGYIRRRLHKLDLPVTISHWRDVGYMLEAPNWFLFEDGAAAVKLARTHARVAP